MDSSRRAVEAYWRSRMIEGATSDEDKVTPVYKLEEICELLRSSHVSIVKEVSEYVLKRLDHKSPVVKQKALRLIKYSVGKSGVEFRREMQRNSAAVRQLFHYKGHPDPLKGDALNKAVRDTAHEALSSIFATEDNKPSPAEDLNSRIEGFGNTNFDMSAASDDKKSFLSEVVGLGSASIKQGLSNIAAGHSLRKNENGSYKGPVLRRSLNAEIDSPDRYERNEYHGETRGSSSGFNRNVGTVTWGQESVASETEVSSGASSMSYAGNKSREERLLETIVTSGGVRLQPSRDALQVFLGEASKLDAVALSHALESKLQSHLWQVRMKAVCVLESILRKKDDAPFGIVASYYSENKDAVVKCSESPQASLREKATKVLSLLGGEQSAVAKNLSDRSSSAKPETPAIIQMPDLIDTGDVDENGRDDAANMQNDTSVASLMTPTTPVIDDLFGDTLVTGISTSEHKNEEDPFADVSFHTSDDKQRVTDLFSGLTVDKQLANDIDIAANANGQEVFDIFGPSFGSLQEPATNGKDMHDLVAGLSTNEKVPDIKPQSLFPGVLSGINSDVNTQPNRQVSNNALNGVFNTQMTGMNQNAMFPLGPMAYNIPPNIMFSPALASQQINYGAMSSFLAQQQLLATMSNFQSFGNQSAQVYAGAGHENSNSTGGGCPPLPDIFNPGIPLQAHSTVVNSPKKEETKAFDFISDHLSAVRDPKRVV